MNEIMELIKRAETGDKEALVKLIMDKKDDYYKLAYLYLNNREDALDALEDMILILYQNIKRLRAPESFYSWSKTILVNCCKKLLKRRKKILFFETPPDKAFNEKYDQKEEFADLNKVLELLNPNQREAIKLRYFLDLDYAAISQLTKVPLGTVKSRISNGLANLKERLGGDYLD